NVSILLAKRENALKIPNAAFRFRPPAGWEAKPHKAAPEAAEVSAKNSKKSSSGTRKKDKRKSERTVYVLSAKMESAVEEKASVPQPVQIKTGINDGSDTEVVEGLREGDEVILTMSTAKASPLQALELFGVAKKKR